MVELLFFYKNDESLGFGHIEFFISLFKVLIESIVPLTQNTFEIFFSNYNMVCFYFIELSIAILLKGYFEREKIILHEKNLKHRKIILLINFIFDPTFFLIASYQI